MAVSCAFLRRQAAAKSQISLSLPALDLVAQVLGPDGVQGAQATGGLDVSDDTDDDHGGSLNDGDGLAGLLLVQLGAGLLDLTQNVGGA
jgi:hypothetical protein